MAVKLTGACARALSKLGMVPRRFHHPVSYRKAGIYNEFDPFFGVSKIQKVGFGRIIWVGNYKEALTSAQNQPGNQYPLSVIFERRLLIGDGRCIVNAYPFPDGEVDPIALENQICRIREVYLFSTPHGAALWERINRWKGHREAPIR